MKNPNISSKSDWMRNYWRPAMAIVYMVIVLFDFLIAPILWSLLQYYGSGDLMLQWNPLTLISGGLFHTAMGVVLGVSAFTRGQEKIQQIKQSNKYNNDDSVVMDKDNEQNSEEFDFDMKD